MVCRLEFAFHKFFYTSYFEKNEVCSGAQECTGCTLCTFSLAFLSVKLDSRNSYIYACMPDDDGLANIAKVMLTRSSSTYRDLRQLCQWVLGSLNHTAH